MEYVQLFLNATLLCGLLNCYCKNNDCPLTRLCKSKKGLVTLPSQELDDDSKSTSCCSTSSSPTIYTLAAESIEKKDSPTKAAAATVKFKTVEFKDNPIKRRRTLPRSTEEYYEEKRAGDSLKSAFIMTMSRFRSTRAKIMGKAKSLSLPRMKRREEEF
jgi:hypothetical protein